MRLIQQSHSTLLPPASTLLSFLLLTNFSIYLHVRISKNMKGNFSIYYDCLMVTAVSILLNNVQGLNRNMQNNLIWQRHWHWFYKHTIFNRQITLLWKIYILFDSISFTFWTMPWMLVDKWLECCSISFKTMSSCCCIAADRFLSRSNSALSSNK